MNGNGPSGDPSLPDSLQLLKKKLQKNDEMYAEWLPAISTPVRAADNERLYDPDRPDEPESNLILIAQPHHIDAYVEWVIEKRIEDGELSRVGGEDQQ